VTEGRSILIVEDEPLIAMMLEDFLETLGHSIHRTCDNLDDALVAVEMDGFDVAILDVNLKGEAVWPVAERLRAKNIPFVIASGGQLEPPPAAFAGVPSLDKPYTIDRITPALEKAIERF
jgi:CheY-like chemotaxis protein